MKRVDLTNVQESGDFQRPSAGGYICTITKVEDYPMDEKTGKGDYLRIYFDIAEGDFAGYYKGLRERFAESKYIGSYVRSYKEAAWGMFKRFCSAVSNSNGDFIFDGNEHRDEQTLTGKKIGIILGEEEYYSNAGEKKTRLYVHSECSIEKIMENDFRIPKLKELKDNDMGFINVPAGTNEEVPF